MDIPVSFEYEGMQFDGFLSPVNGAGSDHYHLMINNYFHGTLWKTESIGWRFGNNKGMFEEPFMIEFFRKTVEEWTARHRK